MKKSILAAALALGAFLPASVSAQEDSKEYNMVITLQNGTTITLGHNDIKNITFNGEEISIAGNALNTIEECFMQIEQVNEHMTQILNGIEADYATKAELEDAYMQIEEANKTMTQILNGISEDYASKSELEEAFLQIEECNKTMTQMLNGLKEDYVSKEEAEEIWNAIQGENGLQEQMTQFANAAKAALEETTNELWEAINGEGDSLNTRMSQYYTANQAAIEEVKAEIDNVYQELNGETGISAQMSQYVKMLQDQIDELSEKVKALEAPAE